MHIKIYKTKNPTLLFLEDSVSYKILLSIHPAIHPTLESHTY